jgi:hypothetical protein
MAAYYREECRISKLDESHFHYESYIPHLDRFQYHLYSTRYPGSTMILKSGDLSICALSFLGTDGVQVLSKRRDNEFFGVSTKECEMQFVLTNLLHPNLCEENGDLNVQILDESGLHRVNKINVLRPSESVHVKGDSRNENHGMRLERMKDSATGKTVSVKESETSKDSAKKQEKFRISVCIESGEEKLVGLVQKAEWTCADTFIRKVQLASPWTIGDVVVCSTLGIPGGEEESEEDMGCGMWDSDEDAGVITERSVGGFYGGTTRDGFSRAAQPAGRAYPDGIQLFSMSTQSVTKSIPESAPISVPKSKRAVPESGFTIEKADAVKIAKSKNKYEVQSSQVVMEFAYDKAPPVCALGFCIWDKMKVEPFQLSAEEMQEMLDAAVKSGDQMLVDSIAKIFESEECTVCMDSSATMVLIQCGHKCVCAGCEKQLNPRICPLCRGKIIAVVPDLHVSMEELVL